MSLQNIVEAPFFRLGVVIVILIGAVCVGLETSPSIMRDYGEIVHTIDFLVIALFVVELGIRLLACRGNVVAFFSNGWNVFDFLITAVCLLPTEVGYVQVFRLVRVLRTLRLASALPPLQVLITATLGIMPSLGYLVMLLFMLLYSYGVVGVFLFGANDPMNFGSLGRSLLTLFSVLTLEGWVDLLNYQMYGSDAFEGYPLHLCPTQPLPAAQPIASVIYFVSFIVAGTMIVLNLFVGVVVQGIESAHAEIVGPKAASPPGELPPS
jgi:voltage-gated sodium channel